MKHFSAWWRLHGKILVGLCMLTILLWQFRFVRCGPNLLPENACESLTHWIGGDTINPAYARADAEGMVLTKQKNQPNFSLFKNLEGIENVRFLAVTTDAAWENAQGHPVIHWLQPRVVVVGYDANNNFCAPLDHGIIGASGTRGWHRVQGVVELPPTLAKARLSIDGFGEEGVMRLRNMRVEVVKQRVWFIPATVVLLGLWAIALGRILRPHIDGKWLPLRAVLIAGGIIFGAWHFVFPQGRTLFVPLVGQFAMGSTIEGSHPDVPPPPAPSVEKPPVPNPVVTSASPEMRQGTHLGQKLRLIDRTWNIDKYNLTHFTAFFGIGLFVFALAGSWRIWPLPCLVALLGEVIPNALFKTWDRGDWWDLFANYSGLAVGLGLVMLVQRYRASHRESRRLGG